MQVKDQLLTSINESIRGVICILDSQESNSSEVISVLDYLVDGTLNSRIYNSENSSLLRDKDPHFFFTKSFNKSLNILLNFGNDLSKNDVNQFFNTINSSADDENCEVLIIKPKSSSYKLSNSSIKSRFFEY